MKNMYKKILIFLIFICTTPMVFAKFRDVDTIEYTDMYDEDAPAAYSAPVGTMETVGAIQDNNQKMYGIVGKSQVLSFDKDIERVSLTDNSIADIVVLSPRQLLINGKKAGTTSMIFWSKDSNSPIFYNLLIQQNTDSFIQAVRHVAPNENVSIIFNDTGAVLTGHVSSTGVKQKIINLANAYNIGLTDLTESPSKQVLLEVKITEANKNFSRSLGVNILNGKHLNMSGDSSTFNIGGWAPSAGVPYGYKTHMVETSNGALSLGFIKNGTFGIDLEASEAKGDIKILAEPKLLAVDGEEGSFTVGNQVPVPSSVGNYGNVSYDYKDTGVILKFTPTIMEDTGRIRLNLKPEVSEVDNSVSVTSALGAEVYGFKTRKVETTVELMSGETLVIAGLMKNTSTRSRNQVPILGNIPVLGTLFSMTNDEKNNDEFIIFITPKIVDNSVNIENL